MSDDIQKYIQCMDEIKRRLEVITLFVTGSITTGYPIPDVECVFLQFRKIFELIALSSLCANRDKYEQISKRFHKEWKADDIIKRVECINPSFYPEPVIQIHDNAGKVVRVEAKKDGFLVKKELTEFLGRCGNYLHADNPYNWKTPNLEELAGTFREWGDKVVGLLGCHIVRLVDSKVQWWVIMSSKGRDGQVMVFEMERQSARPRDKNSETPMVCVECGKAIDEEDPVQAEHPIIKWVYVCHRACWPGRWPWD